ncbi:MAG: hypothetical protein M5U28_14935 [Sandaracinaceae bacterium]|nr:hypothetical protein [Sandaracinaceae bacterium]
MTIIASPPGSEAGRASLNTPPVKRPPRRQRSVRPGAASRRTTAPPSITTSSRGGAPSRSTTLGERAPKSVSRMTGGDPGAADEASKRTSAPRLSETRMEVPSANAAMIGAARCPPGPV